MKLGALIILLLYWFCFIIFFSQALGSPMTEDYNVTGSLNTSGFDSGEIDTGGFLGGLFGDIVGIAGSIIRFFSLAVLGIGLPSSTPSWVQFIFTSWQIVVTLITIAVIISFFWEG